MTSRVFDGKKMKLVESCHDICMISSNYDVFISTLVQSSHDMCVISRNFGDSILYLIQPLHDISVVSININASILYNILLPYDILISLKSFVVMIMEPRYSLPGICSELRNFTMPFYDIYKTHQKFASSPYSISLICIKFENRFEGRKFVVYCKEYFLDFVLFLCERCMDSECFLEWKKNINSEYCRNNIYEIFPIMNKKCAVGMGYQNEFEFCKFGRGKVLRLRLYHYFISCFIYLFIYKYGILDFSLLHHCLKKFDCMNEWVKYHSRCIGISTRDRLHDNVRIEENNVKNISRIVEYTGEMLDFKRNFCGGGRH